MKHSHILVASLLALSSASFAQGFTDYATVLSSEPQYIRTVQQGNCYTTNVQEVQQGQPNTGAAIIGGLLGGVIGHQFGRGTGRDILTAGGAAVGAISGYEMGNQAQVVERPVQHCEQVPVDQINGYKIKYQYGSTTGYYISPYPVTSKKIRVNIDVTPAQ